MKITRVTFYNYRVYSGKQEIDLAPPCRDKPVILIGGLNGEGKTTLIEGIQIALYGRRSEVWQQNGTTYLEYLSQSIHRSSAARDGAMVAVEFEAIDQDAIRNFVVQRSWNVSESGKVSEYIQVFLDGQLDKMLSEDWNDQVERFIPARLAGLFFFDGEKIKHYADPQRSRDLIERGVLSLLGIDLIDQLGIDLKALETRIAKVARKTTFDESGIRLADIRDELQREHKQLREQSAKLLSDHDHQVMVCEASDREYSDKGGTLYEQRINLEGDRRHLMERRNSFDNSLIELAAGPLPLAMVKILLAQCAQQMLIEFKVAGAAAALSQTTEQQVRLTKLMKIKRVAQSTQQLVRDFFNDETSELRQIAEYPTYLHSSDLDYIKAKELLETQIDAACDKAKTTLSSLEEIDDEMQVLDRKLAAVPDDEALAATLKRRDEERHKLSVLEGRIEQVEESRRIVAGHLEDAEKTLHKHLVRVLEGAQDQADNARVLDHAERVRSTLVQFRKRLISQRLSTLEMVIRDSYTNLMRKKGMVADIAIDQETYELKLHNRDGAEILADWLSAGERQLLVVAILWGLARASGRSLPVIVDTPLGRLDSTHRDNLVKHYFPHASHQVILLSTDEEIVGRTLAILAPSIGHQYRLVYDDTSESTVIERGYFKEQVNAN